MNNESLIPEGTDAIDWTTKQQGLASDPERSAWVSANAGSGKTHVLTQRVIRLLLAGARPSSILCLTYTKAAASEMSNRVFSRLSEWARLDDAALSARLAQIQGQAPDRETLTEARRLFAKALETPGGLKIQTIHAFCEALLHQFPLEANVAGHFSVLDDPAAAALLAEARRSLLTASALNEDRELARAFEQVLTIADEHGLDSLLGDIVANRQRLRDFLARADTLGGVELVLADHFGIGPDESPTQIAQSIWPLDGLSGGTLSAYIDLAMTKGAGTAQSIADDLRQAATEEEPWRRLALVESALLTKSKAAKSAKTLMTKAMLEVAPQLADSLSAAQDYVARCRDRLALARMHEATTAALILAQRLIGDYEELKKRRSQLDFEDLIARTADLLTKSDAGPWIHYKLDQGIDHILVDEAQDTSPIQWDVIRSLRDDFFSGEGAKRTVRTFFAVGDEKQSIYSFQGARPERFSEEGRLTEREVDQGGRKFSAIRLPLSFRSTKAILTAVDQVFSIDSNARGLSAVDESVVHMSNRTGQPGRVELWDMIAAPPVVKDEDWTAPFDATPESAPPAVLARRMAQMIGRMIGTEIIIENKVARPIEAGDILVLVRKRDSFVTALMRELKRRDNIPVAGADRLKLTAHIAVQDLLALGRFVLLPADDLSLAALLKSPLFDLSEDELYAVAAYRADRMSLWNSIQEQAVREEATPWRDIVSRLLVLISLSRELPVHDFYARVLGACGGRRRFLGRLGTEAADILDEFLSYAMEFETNSLPGLQAFVSTLEIEAPDIKREQDQSRNEVRIMTVHASKGLEAPVVFLVDGGSAPFNASHLAKFRMAKADGDRGAVPIWVPGKSLENSISAADKAYATRLAEEEYRRLLYVGMTRAADRLIICGYKGRRPTGEIWHDMIQSALRQDSVHCREVLFTGGDTEWRGLIWETPSGPERFETVLQIEKPSRQEPLPEALFRALPPARPLPRPLSPSGVGVFVDDEDDITVTSPLFGPSQSTDRALQKGRLTHRMLQILPDLPAPERAAATDLYVERAARFWPAAERQALKNRVTRVLEHPDLGDIFSLRSQAEVSIMGTLRLGREDRAVSGRIDRIAISDDRVVLVDFKTNRVPPSGLDQVPFSHRAQLAIYSEILRPLYPGRQISCLLVYTENASVITLGDEVLAEALAVLKTV